MRCSRDDPGLERIATLDIETTHYEAELGEIVSIGVGVHDRGRTSREATYDTFHRNGDGETDLVRRAMDRLTEFDADGLVSYNGSEFDLRFIEERLDRNGDTVNAPEIATAPERHTDLFTDRKRRADREGVKWPSLEDCLDTYGYPCPVTSWDGERITNSRFGEEVGPAYLAALDGDSRCASTLRDAIDHYLTTDLEANIALYYADVGENFEPYLLGTERAFS